MSDETGPKFTAHNVRLDDGTETFPSIGYTMDRNPVTRGVKRVLTALYPQGLQGKTIIDVGCLEGGFATEFARMGLSATGVEVRESNYQNCLYVKEHVNLPDLRFLQGDAADISKFGRFDVFFVSGLLYHLDQPRKFIEDVAQNCGKALIIWTHVTHAEETEACKTYALSDLEQNEGLSGRWYPEHGDIPADELNKLKWASWNNKSSFWVQKEYLLQLLKEVGFDLVFEQFDCLDDIISDMTEGFYNKIDRVMLVAVKTGLPAEPSAKTLADHPPLVEHRTTPSKEQIKVTDLAEAQKKVVAAEQALAQSKLMLGAVHSSTSWRVTQPLRWAGRVLGRR
jgi:SAM-dependent methyltransferase